MRERSQLQILFGGRRERLRGSRTDIDGERERERENATKEGRAVRIVCERETERERGVARGQRGRIIRPQNPEAFNIIRYRVSSIGCRGCRERKRGSLEGEREAGREGIEERKRRG